jgi:hypothetical protein
VKGRSQDQALEYDEHLAVFAALLSSTPMTVVEIMGAIVGTPSACGRVSTYLRIQALKERGFNVKTKKRPRTPGRSGWREAEFWIEPKKKR